MKIPNFSFFLMLSPKIGRDEETFSRLVDMVTTLMHNQIIMQNDIQNLTGQLHSTNALVDELLFFRDTSDASSNLSTSPCKISRTNLSKLAKGNYGN